MVHRQTLPPMQSVYQPSAESQVLIPAQQRFRCMPTTWSPEGGGSCREVSWSLSIQKSIYMTANGENNHFLIDMQSNTGLFSADPSVGSGEFL
jgi:hypothetical protein